MPPKKVINTTFNNKIASLAKTAQLYWFIGHVLAIVCFIASLLSKFISTNRERHFFKLAIFMELISYGCVLKQLPPNNFKSARILGNESLQYFVLALTIFSTSFKLPPWTMALTSFIIYSFFHSITYFQANFLDYLPVSLQAKANISQKITMIASNYNEQALYFASFCELSLVQNLLWEIPSMILKIFRDPMYIVCTLVNYAVLVVFLKLRYDESQYTKTATGELDKKILGFLSNPMVPPQLSHIYTGLFKGQVRRIMGNIRVTPSKAVKKNQ